MKFEPDAHLNVICQPYEAENPQLNILGKFFEKLKKSQKINNFLSWPIFTFPMNFHLIGIKECEEKITWQASFI